MAELVIMPKLGFDMAEGTLVRWVKAEGEEIAKGDLLAEIETDKATVEVESPYDGVVLRQVVDEGANVPVGEAIAVVGEEGEEIDIPATPGGPETKSPQPVETAPSAAAPSRPDKPATEGAQLPDGVKASPLARRMAQEQNLDLAFVRGSGAGGRIVKKDVEEALAASIAAEPISSAPTPAPEDTIIPLTRLRAAIGRRMVAAKQQVPHFYVTYDYDMAPVADLRKRVNTLLETEGVKLSINDFIVKAVALNLRQYPNLNASLQGDQVVQHGHVNVGVAVAVPGGLLTVVCQDSDQKSLRQISTEVRRMAQGAREGKVRPEDIEGSTFSVSNLGMYGVDEFTAIINPPEAAILAVGGVRETPVVVDGEIRAGLGMKATISVDHRVSDGAEAAAFMQSLAGLLEEPLHLMLLAE